MSNLTIKLSVFSNGERFPFLINTQTGIPEYWSTLYSITQLRTKGRSSGTIDQVLRSIQILYVILDKHEIYINGLIQRFKDGIIFNLYEIDSLVEECKFRYEDIKKEEISTWPKKLSLNSLEKFRSSNRSSEFRRVDDATSANRIRNIRDFVTWLVDIQSSKLIPTDPFLIKLSENKKDFIDKIDSRIPKVNNPTSTNEKEGLSEEHIKLLLDTINRNSSNNPWKSNFAKVRNELIVIWLFKFGLRRSELLNIKVSDINFKEESFYVLRRADDKEDPRKEQPKVKTKGRKISLPKKILDLTYDYIIKYRSKLPQSKTHEFLFVAAKSGLPMAIITVNKVFEQIRESDANFPKDFSPHILRHTWNDSFSKLMDKGNVPEEQEQKMRNYLMGWSDHSKTSANYTRRHVREKANEVIQELGNKLFDKDIKE